MIFKYLKLNFLIESRTKEFFFSVILINFLISFLLFLSLKASLISINIDLAISIFIFIFYFSSFLISKNISKYDFKNLAYKSVIMSSSDALFFMISKIIHCLVLLVINFCFCYLFFLLFNINTINFINFLTSNSAAILLLAILTVIISSFSYTSKLGSSLNIITLIPLFIPIYIIQLNLSLDILINNTNILNSIWIYIELILIFSLFIFIQYFSKLIYKNS